MNKFQQQKFYNKLHSIKSKYKPQYTPQNFRINQNENKINISNGNMKEDLLNQNDNERINSYFHFDMTYDLKNNGNIILIINFIRSWGNKKLTILLEIDLKNLPYM